MLSSIDNTILLNTLLSNNIFKSNKDNKDESKLKSISDNINKMNEEDIILKIDKNNIKKDKSNQSSDFELNTESQTESKTESQTESKNKDFSLLSYEITKNISQDVKKKNGIYFTPKPIVNQCLTFLTSYIRENKLKVKTILEPCCGSGEFLYAINDHFSKQKIQAIIGVENNNYIYQKICNVDNFSKKHKQKNIIELYNQSFLTFEHSSIKQFDLIIGNPPFYVMSKNNVHKKYHKYFQGRPNIFLLFIVDSLHKLNHLGILCFILPKNFLNCIYYDQLRNYIYHHYQIISIMECNQGKYIDTQQETIILIIQKFDPLQKQIKYNVVNKEYTLNLQKYKIFNTKEHVVTINELLKDSTNLYMLNCNVKVGPVTWNEHKSILTNDKEKTLLIYNGNIKKNQLQIESFKNEEKKNYIDKEGSNNMVLLINRGYGKGNYQFNYCIVDTDKKYLVENHLIVISHKSIHNKEKLRIFLEKIIQSFQEEKTRKFIELYFGNNAINTNELLFLLPIYNFK